MRQLNKLPDYIVADVNNIKQVENTTIRKVAEPFKFPLTEDDKKDINTLILKYDNEKEIAGLAAPQIGISKRAIVFAVPYGYKDEKPFPKSVWVNPTYKKVNDEKEIEFEQCFSVKDVAGPVERYKSVYYKAYTVEGNLVKGVAYGIASRVIQHETDHLDGILFIDLVPKEKLITTKALNRMYEEAVKGEYVK